ncbi:MAG: grasp-with-spasm system ATP-grasp peptide maturase [Cytophagales bacterium]|nr:MAG: grasp-with-spasm system ATP-grasp peptide maturase [Cytophagales bacterium]
MILIISESTDISTINVIDWLSNSVDKKKIIRINSDDKVKIRMYNLNGFELNIFDGINIYYGDISGFWYRRGGLNMDIKIDEILTKSDSLFLNFQEHINNEMTSLIISIYNDLTKNLGVSIGNFLTGSVNKILTLKRAMKNRISVPDTLITTDKQELLSFFNKHNQNIITKSISQNIHVEEGNTIIAAYTEEITNIDSVPDSFEISLFQQKIDKKYELRIFYLKGDFYAMAIFSQLDNQTKVDFRKYNDQKPNRTVPFNLPNHIKNKLKNLMDECKLDTGSIDMIVDQNNNYYFLEVNPVGQFGMVSYPCNYNLEKKIANLLSMSK